jgi:hypothetical protein
MRKAAIAATKKSPVAGLPQFADPALDQVSFQHAEVLDEKHAVQVIDFVAERAREQPFAAHLEDFAF